MNISSSHYLQARYDIYFKAQTNSGSRFKGGITAFDGVKWECRGNNLMKISVFFGIIFI